MMPLTHFLALILTVILAAGLSLWAVTALGLPLVWVALGALACVNLQQVRDRPSAASAATTAGPGFPALAGAVPEPPRRDGRSR